MFSGGIEREDRPEMGYVPGEIKFTLIRHELTD